MSNQKVTSHVNNNKTIHDAIQAIAWHGIRKNRTNQMFQGLGGGTRTTGFVTKLHTEEDDELLGTIDVQEFLPSLVDTDDAQDKKVGLHEGVYLSAIQDNSNSMITVPRIGSEVVISTDNLTGKEYVVMFSHIDIIQLDAHDKAIIGVKEREERDNDDDDDIVLEETGVYTTQEFTKNTISTIVQDEEDSDKVEILIDGKKVEANISNDTTKVIIDQEKANIEHNTATLLLNDDESTLSQGNSMVKVTNGTTYLGSDSSTEDAVLGFQLADLLQGILNDLTGVTTTTQLGPQPFINVAAFASASARISAFKSSHSGFLTNKVQVQK